MTEVLVRNNRTTTDSFVTDAILQDWTRQAHKKAAGWHKWPFTEVRDRTQTFSTEEIAYSSFTAKFKADSIRILQVGGKRLRKTNIEEYQIFREEQSGATDRIFSDFGRTVFINPSIDLSGTVTAWGQYEPALDATDLTAVTVFSDYDEDGNEAILELMTSYLKQREENFEAATAIELKALQRLDGLWQRILDEQHKYQAAPDSEGMFERIDVLHGGFPEDLTDRDQFRI